MAVRFSPGIDARHRLGPVGAAALLVVAITWKLLFSVPAEPSRKPSGPAVE
ncbi:MAG: hypothetical protein U1E93_03820 [Alphaproteobacteria bacterium]